MPKRHRLDYNTDQLAANIRESTGKGVDALFSPQSPTPTETKKTRSQEIEPKESDASPPSARVLAREQASSHASTKDNQENSYQQDAIRKASKLVNLFGHQTVYLRVTEKEKLELKDLAHEWGKKTKAKIGETLLGRIALTMMIEDHKKNNRDSFLSQVLKQTEE